ncbi:hypothetical protein HYFRA_00011285, partial [Hymenoscyphus fraxineus]
LTTSPSSPLLPFTLTNLIPPPHNDPYEINEPSTPTNAQRQQRSLRRTHIAATSVGISPPPRVQFEQQQASEQQELTNDFEDDLESSTPVAPSSHHQSPQSPRRPHRAIRISRQTANAILYTLEEALRQPNPFTPDLIEESASMSDLLGGSPSGPGHNNGGSRQAASGPAGSPVIRGPRDIMRERAIRDAKKKADKEALEAEERHRAEEEQRKLELETSNRRSTERRSAIAAGVAAQQSAQRGSGGAAGQRISDNSQRSDRRSGDRPLEAVGKGGHAVGGGEAATARPRPTQSQQQQPRPVPPQASRPRPSQAQAGPSTSAQPPAEESSVVPVQGKSSFPHAFERWETLSAHWEGLTSFWIRRLEENSEEVNRDPLAQQLSRQVTDLSAAGANLFHAVVELQRLRASSERKFQRWFFETRQEQERSQEIIAGLQHQIEQVRQEATQAVTDAVALERERSNADQKLAEMKRELQISKEEARRAWDELGRRETEERDRTASLREGQPTIVGGVQVVPMMPGMPSRHASAQDAPSSREAHEPEEEAESDVAYQQYPRAQRAQPTDPFVAEERASRSARTTGPSSPASAAYSQGYSQAPAVQPASTSAGFYPQGALHPSERGTPVTGAQSEGAFSEEEYAIDPEGQFILDAQGNRIPYMASVSDNDTDEYDVDEERESEQANRQRYGGSSAEYRQGSTATSGPGPSSQPSSSQPGGADYSGAGYGTGLEWGAVPRHHHPTRLSDVLEEDERSRTSASQVSRRE